MLIIPKYEEIIAKELSIKIFQVNTVLELTKEGATVPFIARYRKERTGNLDENEIRAIIELKNKEENIYHAKITATKGIEELGKMTPELMNNIINAKTLKEVEELYKPYKSKKKTKAMIALEKGFGAVAESLKRNKIEIPEILLQDYSREEIIDGAIEIIGAEVNTNSILRHTLIEELQKEGIISSNIKSEKVLSKLNEKVREQISKFNIYKEFNTKIKQIKPYQILALNRGENLGILHIKIEKDVYIFETVQRKFTSLLPFHTQIIPELKESFKRGFESLFASVENEIRANLQEYGEDDSIQTFQTNLKALLMTRPEKVNSLLSIDPGFRVGSKICVLDKLGNPLFFDKIYLFEIDSAKKKLSEIIKKYSIEVIVIGNGTGSKETASLVHEIFEKDIYIVNEAGASVYSVSEIAKEEFKDLDSLDKGTISIGRRFIDPLSEIVKIPVGSIGVGMYQHDIAEKKLEQKLGYVVETAVNEVGVNVNTASIYVLSYISGIDKRQAKKIFDNRPYTSRKEIKKVLSQKSYEQAIGFLRVPDSHEALDNTDIHPDQYSLAYYIINSKKREIDETMKALYPDTTTETITFILSAYDNIGKEKRINSTHTRAKKILEEIKEGDTREGIVRNVVPFGAFVDIGTKNDGLVHISELSNTFIKNPMDIVKVGDSVKVRVVHIDEKGKVQLSMRNL